MAINTSKLLDALAREIEIMDHENFDDEILCSFQYTLSRMLEQEEDRGREEITIGELNSIISRSKKETISDCIKSANNAESYIWEIVFDTNKKT